MKVSVEDMRTDEHPTGVQREQLSPELRRHFVGQECEVRFDVQACGLVITPCANLVTKRDRNMQTFKVLLRGNSWTLESDDVNKLHPYFDQQQVAKYGERYQFRIKHNEWGTLTLNCKNYYEWTRWIHFLRSHSMDTWSWAIK